MEQGMQRRTELLLGKDNLEKIQQARVLIFGIGGVGSWCAEGLVRSGVRNITIVDSDRICMSNCNRQLMATSRTIGQVKVDALRDRLLEINPSSQHHGLSENLPGRNCRRVPHGGIRLHHRRHRLAEGQGRLILRATALPKEITFVSSMGAALRRDPFMVRKAEFWKVDGDPLARALRKKFKKNKTFPRRKFQCVFSEEKPMQNMSDQRLVEDEWTSTKPQINGSLCHITATFGMAIAGIVINHIIEK